GGHRRSLKGDRHEERTAGTSFPRAAQETSQGNFEGPASSRRGSGAQNSGTSSAIWKIEAERYRESALHAGRRAAHSRQRIWIQELGGAKSVRGTRSRRRYDIERGGRKSTSRCGVSRKSRNAARAARRES